MVNNQGANTSFADADRTIEINSQSCKLGAKRRTGDAEKCRGTANIEVDLVQDLGQQCSLNSLDDIVINAVGTRTNQLANEGQ